MLKIGAVVAGILALLLWFAIRRYRDNPSNANVWLVAWVFCVCIVFGCQILMYAYLYGLRN